MDPPLLRGEPAGSTVRVTEQPSGIPGIAKHPGNDESG
jgi:hypothetical protein